jgi:acetylornithine deacetylase/succinyl-diaminopimelate desuccinylase-like protein
LTFSLHNLADKDETYLLKMLNTVQNATCTTHPVKDESEAIQMFIFQNNRGKKPSNLEIIKAQFMFNVHLYGGEEKESLIEEIKNRFEKIYKSISSIEYNINEDDVLVYTLRVHFNSLWETNAIEKINKLLSDGNPIPFIKSFTQSLSNQF